VVSNRGFIVFLEIIIEMYYRYLMCFLCFFDYLIKYPSILCFPLTNKKAISINDFSLFSFLKVECNGSNRTLVVKKRVSARGGQADRE
jgi:hypothetical protein